MSETKAIKRANVSCMGCRLCCINDVLILHPEDGDDPKQYKTQDITNPFTGEPAIALQRKDNGECIYLGSTGCTIHDRSPFSCQQFDCRKLYKKIRRMEPLYLAKLNLTNDEKSILAQGKKLLKIQRQRR